MLYILLAAIAASAAVLLMLFKVAQGAAWTLLVFAAMAAFVAWVEGRRDRF